MILAVGVMFVRVDASFANDPLLRLQGFGRQAGPAPTTADCGSALSNLGNPSGGGTLYEVARDRACHDVSQRRAAIAFAGGLLLVVLGVAGMLRVERAEPASTTPGPDVKPELSRPALEPEAASTTPGPDVKPELSRPAPEPEAAPEAAEESEVPADPAGATP